MEQQQAAPPQLDASRFHIAEQERTVFICTVEAGVTRKQMMDPIYWAHVAARWLRPYAEIIVRQDDGKLYARFLVLKAERTYAQVYCLEWHDLTTRDVSLTQDEAKAVENLVPPAKQFEVKYMGPHKKWSVIRADSKPPAYLRDGEATEEAARTWLNEYLKVTT